MDHIQAVISRQQVAESAGCNLTTLKALIRLGIIPGPTHRIVKHVRYTPQEADVAIQAAKDYLAAVPARPAGQPGYTQHDLRRARGYASMTEVAKRAGTSRVALDHYVQTGRIPTPDNAVDGCVGLYYDRAGAEDAVRLLIAMRSRRRKSSHDRIARGLHTKADVCQAVGISRSDLAMYIRYEGLSEPTHRSGPNQWAYYNESEFEAVVSAAKQAMRNKQGEAK